MNIIKFTLLIIFTLPLINCASGYKMIQPKTLNYTANNKSKGIQLEYKYDLLYKKYKKKEDRKSVKLVALKITNNSGGDLSFGKDIKLTFKNESEVYLMDNEDVFNTLKQSTLSYLWYLLLTPVNLYTTETNSNGQLEESNTIPIGLVLGPGLAGGNIIAASSANTKFHEELMEYNLYGKSIKNGETRYGLVGIKTNYFPELNLKIE